MPMPSVLPTMTARPKPKPRIRLRALLEGDKEHIDGLADVAGRVARAARFELDVAARPSIDLRCTARGVLDGSAREVNDERVGAVRVKRFARANVHARADDSYLIVLEHRDEAHALERRVTRCRSRRWDRDQRRRRA